MADPKKETKAEQPAFDPNKLLRQLEAIVKSKSKSVDRAHGNPARVSKSWYWAIILPVIVLAGIALVAWLSQRSNRELAKLRHEKNKTKILKEQTELFLELNKSHDQVAEAQKQIDASRDRLRVIEADITAEEKRHETDMHALHRIRTWDGSYRRMGG